MRDSLPDLLYQAFTCVLNQINQIVKPLCSAVTRDWQKCCFDAYKNQSAIVCLLDRHTDKLFQHKVVLVHYRNQAAAFKVIILCPTRPTRPTRSKSRKVLTSLGGLIGRYLYAQTEFTTNRNAEACSMSFCRNTPCTSARCSAPLSNDHVIDG